jgi:predicted porin
MKNRAAQISFLTAATLLAASTGVQALEIKSGNDKVDVKIYGQVNRALMFVDDGNDSKLFHVDNNNSSTRIGLQGKVKSSDNLTVGSNFELEWTPNSSQQVSMEKESISGTFADRLVEVYADFKNTGKFSLGKGNMASEDTSEVDLSGTNLAGFSDVARIGGSVLFYNPAAEEEDPAYTIRDIFSNMDGLGKKYRVRYDTPTFSGFSLAAAAAEQENYDIALTYSGDFSGTKVKAAVAYSDPNSTYTTINGSASVLFPFGLNFTVASGVRDLDNMPADGDDPTFMYGKIGYKCDTLFSVGSTAISVDYGVYENIKKQNIGQEGTTMGVQFVQQISAYSSELYAAYRSLEVEDTTSVEYDTISVLFAGARVRF